MQTTINRLAGSQIRDAGTASAHAGSAGMFYEVFPRTDACPAGQSFNWFELVLHAEAGPPPGVALHKQTLLDQARELIESAARGDGACVEVSRSYYSMLHRDQGEGREGGLSCSVSLVFSGAGLYANGKEPDLLQRLRRELQQRNVPETRSAL